MADLSASAAARAMSMPDCTTRRAAAPSTASEVLSGSELTNGRSSTAESRRAGSTKPTNLSDDSACSALNAAPAGIFTDPLIPAARRNCRWWALANDWAELCPRRRTGRAARTKFDTASGEGVAATIWRYSAETLALVSFAGCFLDLFAALAAVRALAITTSCSGWHQRQSPLLDCAGLGGPRSGLRRHRPAGPRRPPLGPLP